MITRSPLMIQYPGYWLSIKLDCLSLIFNIMIITKTGSPFRLGIQKRAIKSKDQTVDTIRLGFTR